MLQHAITTVSPNLCLMRVCLAHAHGSVSYSRRSFVTLACSRTCWVICCSFLARINEERQRKKNNCQWAHWEIHFHKNSDWRYFHLSKHRSVFHSTLLLLVCEFFYHHENCESYHAPLCFAQCVNHSNERACFLHTCKSNTLSSDQQNSSKLHVGFFCGRGVLSFQNWPIVFFMKDQGTTLKTQTSKNE